MRIVFMGTPEFAVPVLGALCGAGYEIAAVISQPDREKDKKGNVIATPVKRYALENGLNCLQFDRVSQHVAELKALKPDVMITAAYGQLLSADVLDVAPLGVLNVHASILPEYRGSSPIQTALLCGESETGVTIMKTDIGMDTGDILSMVKVPVLCSDNAQTLTDKLSGIGAELLVKTLPDYAAGKIKPIKQDDSKATHCKKIIKADALIDWKSSAHEISCKVRAFNPWPVAFSYLDGVPFKIYAAEEVKGNFGAAGTVTVSANNMTVACGEGGLKLLSVQIPGKKVLPIADFLRGKKIINQSVLNND